MNEGLIEADMQSVQEGSSIIFVTVRGLSGQDLQMIQELPDPNRYLLDRLDAIALAIRGLQSDSKEDKEAADKALEAIKDFGVKFGSAVAAQILAALIKGGQFL